MKRPTFWIIGCFAGAWSFMGCTSGPRHLAGDVFGDGGVEGTCTASMSVSLSGDSAVTITSADGTQQYTQTTSLTVYYDGFQGTITDSLGAFYFGDYDGSSFFITPYAVETIPGWLSDCLASSISYTDPTFESPPLAVVQQVAGCGGQKTSYQNQYDYMANVIIPYGQQISDLKEFLNYSAIVIPTNLLSVILADRALQRLRNLWPGACMAINMRCQAWIDCCRANPGDTTNCPANCNPNNCGGLNFTY